VAVVKKKDIKVTRVVGGFQPAVCVGRGFGRLGVNLYDRKKKEILGIKRGTRVKRDNEQKEVFSMCDHMARVVKEDFLELLWDKFSWKTGYIGKFSNPYWRRFLKQLCMGNKLDVVAKTCGLGFDVELEYEDNVYIYLKFKAREITGVVDWNVYCKYDVDEHGHIQENCKIQRRVYITHSFIPYTYFDVYIVDEAGNELFRKRIPTTFATEYRLQLNKCEILNWAESGTVTVYADHFGMKNYLVLNLTCSCPGGFKEEKEISIWDIESGGYVVRGDSLSGYSNCKLFKLTDIPCFKTLRAAKQISVINAPPGWVYNNVEKIIEIDEYLAILIESQDMSPPYGYYFVGALYNDKCKEYWDQIDFSNLYHTKGDPPPPVWIEHCDGWFTFIHRNPVFNDIYYGWHRWAYLENIFIVRNC